MSTLASVPPPSPQEVTRKLSVHSVSRNPPKKSSFAQKLQPPPALSGTESDSDSTFSPDLSASQSGGALALSGGPSSNLPPLTSIAERRNASGEETDEDEEEDEAGWRVADIKGKEAGGEDVVKAGYLSKKGARRKTWKKRWFVLRPSHLAYYKSDAEYKLLRLLDLTDIHTAAPVALKRHPHAFGIVTEARTFYLQASTDEEVEDWVKQLNAVRERLQSTSSVTTAVPIPARNRPPSVKISAAPQDPAVPSAPRSPVHNMTSSDSEDGGPSPAPSAPMGKSTSKDPAKTILSGYLMKCGSKRRNWRKRWFVLTGEQLIYSGSHMDTKPHRQIPLTSILDAIEYTPAGSHHGHHRLSSPAHPSSTPVTASSPLNPSDTDDTSGHTFKIITPKRTLMLCAPSEEEEIKWLSAVRALIARRTGGGTTSSGISPSGSGGVGKEKEKEKEKDATGGQQPSAVATSAPSGSKKKEREASEGSRRKNPSTTAGLVAAATEVVGAGGEKQG